VVGFFTTSISPYPQYGFIYDHGTYTILNFPDAVGTGVSSINAKGQILGGYATGSEGQVTGQESFIYSGGTFTTIPPETGGPSASDINNRGQIVGTYTGADGNTHGFLTQDSQDKGQALANDTFVFAPNLGENTSVSSNMHGAQALANDTFVFAPNLGEQTSAQLNVHNDAIDHPRSEFTQLAELLAQSHQDPASLAHDPTDGMHDAATLAAQHAHHFLV
jgi:probable HAF family extracellular repeat protein